jgi:hypothetical protein
MKPFFCIDKQMSETLIGNVYIRICRFAKHNLIIRAPRFAQRFLITRLAAPTP